MPTLDVPQHITDILLAPPRLSPTCTEAAYYERQMRLAILLLTGALKLAMHTYWHGEPRRFAETTIDQIVSAARSGYTIVVYAVPFNINAREITSEALEQGLTKGTICWLGDYDGPQPACGALLCALHAEFTGEHTYVGRFRQ